MKKCVLMFCENPVPAQFTRGTVSAKEARLRSAIRQIDTVHIIARSGVAVQRPDQRVGPLEKKVHVHLLPPCPYYLAPIPLFFWGLYHVWKLRPVTLESESPILSGPVVVILGKLFGIPSIVELRASYDALLTHRLTFVPLLFKRLGLRMVMKLVLTHADAVIANSSTYQAKLKAMGIVSTVINPGIQQPPKQGKEPVQAAGDPVTFGYLGRLVPEKGVPLLLQACARIRDDGASFRLLIAGDGPERLKIEQFIVDYGLSDVVTLVGWQDTFGFLHDVDVLINPNMVKHPLEMANAEAAYMGVPVVTFGDDDIPETVQHQKTGLVVDDATPITSLYDVMLQLLDPTLRARLGRAGRHFAKKHYDFDEMVNRLRTLYQELGVLVTTT